MNTGEVKNLISGWEVQSLADGTLLVKPQWVPKPYEEGCAPVGVLTRISLADWLLMVLHSKTKAHHGKG